MALASSSWPKDREPARSTRRQVSTGWATRPNVSCTHPKPGGADVSYGVRPQRGNSLHRELTADLRAHRPAVIADLLAEYGAAIGGVAYLIVRDASDAEEIVMDTLETAWRQAHKLRDDGALRTWLLRIATRQALSRRRRQRTSHPLEDAAWQGAPAWSEPSLDRLIVAEALSALPERMRAAVALHHYAGLTVPQTAQAMGSSENTIKSQLREGMARLRQALDAPPAVAARRSENARRA